MKLKDKFIFVRDNMKKNRSRVFMTILATAMGCAFLMVLASVGFGLQKTIVQDITESRVVTEVEVYGKDKELHLDKSSELTDKDVEYFESLENVKTVVRRKSLENYESYYRFGDYRGHAGTRVVHYPSEITSDFSLSEGRMPEAPNEVVVGFHTGMNFWLDGDAATGDSEKDQYKGNLLNEEITIFVAQNFDGERKEKEFTLKVVGIAEAPSKEWMTEGFVNISDEMLSEIEAFTGTALGRYIDEGLPKDLQNEIKNASSSYTYIGVFTQNMEQVQGVLDVLKDKGYYVWSPIQELKEINLVFSIMKIGLLFVGTIAVLIASIGIFNTMSMAVTERTQDIGIIKAIGGNPSTIKSLFLMESAYIGIIGAFIGTVAAYVISFSVNLAVPFVLQGFFGEEIHREIKLSYIPWTLTLISVSISTIVAILSGLKPASKATKIDVLKALRRDI
ncbi:MULTISPECIES: ABC transporter permease [Bacillus]|uniref:ABC transporter permease n=1 Tax=Bacillus TaxID=1386 RepID=UPI000BB8500C|nr:MULTISPECIES: ABC transporter permease [Bacillus]